MAQLFAITSGFFLIAVLLIPAQKETHFVITKAQSQAFMCIP